MSLKAVLLAGEFFLRVFLMQVNTRLIGLALLGVVTVGCQKDDIASTSGPAESAVGEMGRLQAVRVASPVRADLLESLDYIGTVQRERTMAVVARVPATIIEALASDGDEVEKGVPLIRMAAPELDARVERVRAEMARVQAEQEFQCETARTDQELAEEGMLTQALADASQVRCTGATNALRASQAAFDEAREARRRLVEVAPTDGVILERLVEPGEFVAMGRPLFLIGAGALELHVSLTESDFQRGVGVGTQVKITTGHHQARSVVHYLAPMARGPGRTVEARITLPSPLAEILRPGMSADLSFIINESPGALTVPEEAILQRGDEAFVFLVDGERLKELPVESGIQSGGQAEVFSPDLNENSVVVIGGLESLKDGQPVYPVPASVGGQK